MYQILSDIVKALTLFVPEAGCGGKEGPLYQVTRGSRGVTSKITPKGTAQRREYWLAIMCELWQ